MGEGGAGEQEKKPAEAGQQTGPEPRVKLRVLSVHSPRRNGK